MLMPLIHGAFLILVYMTLLFLLAWRLRDNSIADIGWGMGFVLVGWYTCLAFPASGFLLLLLITLWGLRLSGYLWLRRHRKKAEDWRYAQWRREWGKNWLLRSFLQVYLLQGAFMWIIALPVMRAETVFAWKSIQVAGVLVAGTGFLWEALADGQLMRFKAKPENKGKIMTKGLWALSRHPNYFGEIVFWWGIFLLTIPGEGWWWNLLSPVTVTWLLSRVSGVPMLEKKYEDHPEYRKYIEETPALWPGILKLRR